MTESELAPADPPIFPFASGHTVDIHPDYARLRRDDPVPLVRLGSGGQAYLATRYDDVKRVFADPVFSRAASSRPGAAVLTQSGKIPHLMLNMDPPDHTRMRKLVARAFTTRAVERMRPRAQDVADELVDAMIAQGPPVDFVAAFAAPLPALVVSEMLGVPAADRDRLLDWLSVTLSIGAHPPERIQQVFGEVMTYLGGLIAAKRAVPADDLLSALIAARDEEDRLSEPELLYNAYLLISGGFETTAGLLANSVLVLDRHPDQRDLLRERPELIPAAVDELLRYVPIAWCALQRIALDDVELSGVKVPAGSSVVPMTYSANRDEALVEEPDRFDVTRPPMPHMALGHGVHRCLGAPLARLEIQTAFATLVRRLPDLRPAGPESELEWKRGVLTVGPVALPVVW